MADIKSPENIKQIQENRDLIIIYFPENVLNINETSLYQKILLNYILVTEASNRGKRSKERITLTLIVNAISTNKQEPQLIRKSKNSRYFKYINY